MASLYWLGVYDNCPIPLPTAKDWGGKTSPQTTDLSGHQDLIFGFNYFWEQS
jgi:hypothetical protein